MDRIERLGVELRERPVMPLIPSDATYIGQSARAALRFPAATAPCETVHGRRNACRAPCLQAPASGRQKKATGDSFKLARAAKAKA